MLACNLSDLKVFYEITSEGLVKVILLFVHMICQTYKNDTLVSIFLILSIAYLNRENFRSFQYVNLIQVIKI